MQGFWGFAQAYKGAALDPRRDFVPFETHFDGLLGVLGELFSAYG